MSERQKRGFAAMSPEKRQEIARKGGHAAHVKGTAHEFSSEEACRAGHIGGKAVSANRAHMAAIGRKGGQRSVYGSTSARTQQQAVTIPQADARIGANVYPSPLVLHAGEDHGPRVVQTDLHEHSLQQEEHPTTTHRESIQQGENISSGACPLQEPAVSGETEKLSPLITKYPRS